MSFLQHKICYRKIHFKSGFVSGIFRFIQLTPSNANHLCLTNNVWNCCVRVGSGMQECNEFDNSQHNIGTGSASRERYNPQYFIKFYHLLGPRRPMCNARAWSQNCQKRCANGCNIVALRFGRSRNKRNVGSFLLKSLTSFKLCAATPNNTQQHATVCANGLKI